MKDLLAVFGGGVFFVILMMVSPSILLWSINTILESSGSSFYVPHGIWTYLACWGLFFTLRGGSSK